MCVCMHPTQNKCANVEFSAYESTLFMKGTNKHVDNILDLGGRPPAHRG